MTILRDAFAEIFAMFLGDARLSAAILAVVAIAAGLIDLAAVRPPVGGGVLLIGCLAVCLGSVGYAARRQRTKEPNARHGRHGRRESRPAAFPATRSGPPGRAGRWLDRMRQRRALNELEDRLLDDIGVSKDAADAESRRLD